MSESLPEAVDGVGYYLRSNNQDWSVSWHSPDGPAPEGVRHGSAAICVTPDGNVILVSGNRGVWDLPAGRPEGDEDWRQTLDREMLEETCSVVENARLLCYSRGLCVKGPQEGLVLIRALWRADVRVLEWEPRFEITQRRIVSPAEAFEVVIEAGMPEIFRRWFREAGVL